MAAAFCEHPCSTTTSGRFAGKPIGTYLYMLSAPGLEPKLLTGVSVAPAGELTESTTSMESMKRRIQNLRARDVHATCRVQRTCNIVLSRAPLLDQSNRDDFRRGREPSVIDDGAMVDTPRTKLQPRPVRLVHKLR